MIIIKSSKNYKCLSFLLIILLSIYSSSCSKKINDYIIKNIAYGKNRKDVSVDLEFDETKIFNIKDYNIDQVRPNSNIKLIKKLTFHARALTPKIFQFLIVDKNSKRFMPPLLDPEFKLNLLKEKESNIDNNLFNLDDMGFELNGLINEPFGFKLKDQKTKENIYYFDGGNFLYSDTLIMFDQLLTTKYIYGFGERNFEFNLEVGKYTTWPNDTTTTYKDKGTGGYNLMGHQPIGLHKTKNKKYLGFIFMNINAQDLIINTTDDKFKNKDNNDFKYYMRHITIGGIINYFITFGDTPEEAILEIHKIIGRPTLPPYWAFGWHQSRWGYKITKDFEKILDNYNKYDIPLEAIWADLDLLQNNKNFILSVSHNLTPKFVDKLHSLGKKFVPILDYGLPVDDNYKYYNLGKKTKSFIKSNYTKKDLFSYVWPGLSVFPDLFTKEGQNVWLEGLYDFYSKINFDGVWIDMNEPAMLYLNDKDIGEIVDEELMNSSYFNIFNDIPYIPGYRKGHTSLSSKSVSINGYSKRNKKDNFYTMYNVKSLIPKIQVELTYNFLKYYTRRPFILSRGNTIGQGKYGFHWLGDNLSNFNHLKSSIPGIFNYNIFGIPFTGADICGFHKNATDELCARWHVLGAFYPFSRNHNVDNALSQEPWVFDTLLRRFEVDTIDENWPKEGYTLFAAKKAIKLKYSLLRYTYTQLFLISLGIKGAYFKPIFFEFPEDEILFNEMNVLNTHIMLGDSFLFIPNLNKLDSNYMGYFPNCNFNKFPEGNNFVDYIKGREMGQFMELNGGYLDINIFLRGGKIIPYQNSKGVSSTNDLRHRRTTLIINPDQNKKASGNVIYDTDEIDSIDKKIYLHMMIEFNKDNLKFKIINLGRKNNSYEEDVIEDIILYRASELNSDIFKSAEIYSYRDKPYRKELIYDKAKDILTISLIQMPIYLLSNIYFEI